MNLAPRRVALFSGRGIAAVHWSSSGIEQGVLITIDPQKTRLHILPFVTQKI
jgi:hypothetical protein